MNYLTEHDLLEWPTYDVGLPLAQQDTSQPPYSRPDRPKQPWRPPHQPRDWRDHALDVLFTAGLIASIAIACGLVLLFLVALALGMRDLIRLALGSP